MNSSVTKVEISWSSLSDYEKDNGIYPNKLKELIFDIDTNEISKNSEKIYQFFLKCRLAASKSEFIKGINNVRVRLSGLNQSQILKNDEISKIAHDALMTELPKEKKITTDDIDFEDEGRGNEYKRYKKQFVEIYNHFIEKQTNYLMHPLRKQELVKILVKKTTLDQDLLAARLIELRCWGKNWLDNFESYNKVIRFENKLKKIKLQIKQLDAEGVRLIKINDYSSLRERDFSFIEDKLCRKYVLITYKFLASQNLLEILNLPEKALYYIDSVNMIAHEALIDIVKLFDNEASVASVHFGVVVEYLKQLMNNDLNELKRYYLLKEEERMTQKLEHQKKLFGMVSDRIFKDYKILLSETYESLFALSNIGVLNKISVIKYQVSRSRL